MTSESDYRMSDVSATRTPLDPAQADWRETWAYLIGMQAYAYGFPAIYYTKLRFGMVRQPQGVVEHAAEHALPCAAPVRPQRPDRRLADARRDLLGRLARPAQ